MSLVPAGTTTRSRGWSTAADLVRRSRFWRGTRQGFPGRGIGPGPLQATVVKVEQATRQELVRAAERSTPVHDRPVGTRRCTEDQRPRESLVVPRHRPPSTCGCTQAADRHSPTPLRLGIRNSAAAIEFGDAGASPGRPRHLPAAALRSDLLRREAALWTQRETDQTCGASVSLPYSVKAAGSSANRCHGHPCQSGSVANWIGCERMFTRRTGLSRPQI